MLRSRRPSLPIRLLSQRRRCTEPPRQARGPRKAKDEIGRSKPANVVVKSLADSKGKDRFYTSIRLPRELWDGAGFGPDDRLLLDWSGKALSIERANQGGVKPKTIGDTSVVLQSWKLGNLNFDQPKVTNSEGSLRLTIRPSGTSQPGVRDRPTLLKMRCSRPSRVRSGQSRRNFTGDRAHGFSLHTVSSVPELLSGIVQDRRKHTHRGVADRHTAWRTSPHTIVPLR